MFAQTQTVRAFSHRGGRLEYDENTLSAFEASRDAGYNGFETDIRMTKDGYLIINHDHTLERTTNGTGILEEKTLKELLALETKGGHRLMTLDELMKFLKTCRQDGLYVEFELKTKPVELYPQENQENRCHHRRYVTQDGRKGSQGRDDRQSVAYPQDRGFRAGLLSWSRLSLHGHSDRDNEDDVREVPLDQGHLLGVL